MTTINMAQAERVHNGMQAVLEEVGRVDGWATLQALLGDLEATRRRIRRAEAVEEMEIGLNSI